MLAGVMLTPVATRASEGPDPIYPTLAGVNVIHADGISGIKMMVPEDVEWWSENIGLEVGQNVHRAMAGIRNRHTPPPFCELCFNGTFIEYWDYPFPPGRVMKGRCAIEDGSETDCPVDAGVIEVYIVSDGPVTITMRFPELEGELEINATGQVDGLIEEIPAECFVPDCSVVGGSTAHEIGLDGKASFAGVDAWAAAYDPGLAGPAEAQAVACAYPGFFNPTKSPDPEEHPYGCDLDDPLNDRAATFWWQPGVWLNAWGTGMQDFSGRTHGLQYLGFSARHRGTLVPSDWSAYAYWIDEGIRCPSGNFNDCATTSG